MAFGRVLFSAISAFPLVVGCASHRVRPMTGRELVEYDEKWASAVAANDSGAAADYWSEHAVMYLPDAPPIYGRQSIQESLEKSTLQMNADSNRTPTDGTEHSNDKLAWTPCCGGIDDGGSMAYTLGEGSIRVTDAVGADRPLHARYVAIWHKEKDRWRCAVKVWTPTRN